MVLAPFLLAIPLGALVGVTGVGGFLLVPLLLGSGFDPGTAIVATLTANVAASTGMAGFVVRRRAVEWSTFVYLVAGTVAGATIALPLLRVLDDSTGAYVAAALLALCGTVVIIHAMRPCATSTPRLPASGSVVLIGALAQISAVFAGIGGPAFTVPALLARGMEEARAIGTAIAHGVLVSCVGIASLYAARGLDVSALEAFLPSAALAVVAVGVRSFLLPAPRRRWLEVVVGVLAFLGAWSAVIGGGS